MIGWQPPDGSGEQTPGEQARRAAVLLFTLVGALGTVLGAARTPALLWLGIPCLAVAVALLVAPSVRDLVRRRRSRD